MLVDATLPVPASLRTLLAGLAPLFTAPSFRTFCGLACGFLAQTGKRTVCGMLAGAGLARSWNHDRAHRFFSRARWSPEELGLAVARLVVPRRLSAGTCQNGEHAGADAGNGAWIVSSCTARLFTATRRLRR
jgi:DDE superfamily endonuclease